MDHEADEPHCRICFAGPRGLADALIEPCACSGTAAYTHVSCLRAWQVHKMQMLRDPTRCEVCSQLYRVPGEAQAPWEATKNARQAAPQLRLMRLWGEVVRPGLARLAAGALHAARVVVTLCHWWLWLGQAAYVAMDAAGVPQLPAGALPPPQERLLPFIWVAVSTLAAAVVVGLGGGGGIIDAWLGANMGHEAAAAIFEYCCLEGMLALQRFLAHSGTSGASGAAPTPGGLPPRRRSPAADIVGTLVSIQTVGTAFRATRVPAFMLALLGPLAPAWLGAAARAGHALLELRLDAIQEESKLSADTSQLLLLFRARPAALAALHAALMAAGECSTGLGSTSGASAGWL